jgi:hypothetical protein
MTTLREAAEKALEALDAGIKISPESNLHDGFRAALAVQPQAEPVEVYGLRRYLNDVRETGTANERTVAVTALRMLAAPPAPAHEADLSAQPLKSERLDTMPTPPNAEQARQALKAMNCRGEPRYVCKSCGTFWYIAGKELMPVWSKSSPHCTGRMEPIDASRTPQPGQEGAT